MSLDRCLCRLEKLFGGCPECGHSPGPPEAYEVIWEDSEEAGDASPEFCKACGRQTVFVVGWKDLDLQTGRRVSDPGEGTVVSG